MRTLRTVILVIGLAAVAACGGKDKGEATTPDNTGGDTGGATYGGDMGGGAGTGADPCAGGGTTTPPTP